MIISFDGNVYTGKTTLIRRIHSTIENTIIVHEYFNDISYLETHSYLDCQLFFLSQERNRIPIHSKSDSILLDRSFLSVIGHSYAMDKMNNTQELSHIINITKKMISTKEIILPDYFFFLNDNLGIYNDIDNKGTISIYFNSEYRKNINDFIIRANSYLNWSKIISSNDTHIVQNTINNIELASNYNSVFQFLNSLLRGE